MGLLYDFLAVTQLRITDLGSVWNVDKEISKMNWGDLLAGYRVLQVRVMCACADIAVVGTERIGLV